MSLINQMLRDLEQRRTTEIEVSPLGGLSASGSITQAVGISVNYVTLSIVMAMIFMGGVLVAYLLGGQQQTVITENMVAAIYEEETSSFVTHIVPENTKITPLPTMEKSDFTVTTKTKAIKTTAKKTVAEKITPAAIRLDVENIIETAPVSSGDNINKIIRPLTNEQQSQLAFQHALDMLARNNQQSARIALEDALSFSPAHLQARETLAAILLNTGRISEAASRLNEGLHLMPDAAPLAKLYARILVDQGDTADAITVLERAPPTVKADPEYHALLAALYQQVKKYVQAAKIYQQILLQHPEVAQWWMGLGLAQDAMGKANLALEAFQRAQHTGGLGDKVLKYVQARIIALTPVTIIPGNSNHHLDEHED